MDHRQRIAALLQQWLEMSRAETQAIQAGDWISLRKIQGEKAALRATLGQATEHWRTENPIQASANPFREEAAQLLALATQNGSLLAVRKGRAQEKKRLLEQAKFNLRRVRSSYTMPERTVLNSYS